MAIARINQFEAKAGAKEKVYVLLESMISTVRACPGCLSRLMLRGIGNPACLAIIEQWDSVESHRRAAQAIPLDKFSEAMTLFAKPASGMYYGG